MHIRLSDHFDYSRLLRFTLPSVIMMVFTSVYGVVDGLFVSNFVGKTSFAALNFIFPFIMVLGTLGFMFGAGGSALVGKTLGEGNSDKANRIFSFILWFSAVIGIAVGAVGFTAVGTVATLLGAEGSMLGDCILYGRISFIGMPFFMLQMEFQSLFITSEKPKLGLFATVAAGLTNIVLDALFIAGFGCGLAGAAAATVLGQTVGGLGPIFYFARQNSSLLRIIHAGFDGPSLLRICVNGSSELMSNISMSLVGMLYNVQLIRFAGENGVAAYGVLMYVNFVFLAIFIGYSIGTAPLVSYNYGAKRENELKNLFWRSVSILVACSLVMFTAAELFARPIAAVFVGFDGELYDLTLRGFRIFSFSFLLADMAIFGSCFFTALNDGLTSALIAFLRTVVFQTAAILLLPIVLGVDGIWISIVVAELMAVLATLFFLKYRNKEFHYL